MIRRVKLQDYEQISQIIKEVFFDGSKEQDSFLMSHISKERFEKLIASSGYCYVIEEEAIQGFLLAYPSSLIEYGNEINDYFLKYFDDEYIYIYQVAVKYPRKGLARKLYQRLFEDVAGLKVRVISSAKPYNLASEKFHEAMGFKKIGSIERRDGGSNFVYENSI